MEDIDHLLFQAQMSLEILIYLNHISIYMRYTVLMQFSVIKNAYTMDLLHSDRWIARSIVSSDVDGRKSYLHFL